MKKFLSIMCSLALLTTVCVPAFAATNNNDPVINALGTSFSVDSKTYSLPSSFVSDVEQYLASDPISSPAQASKVANAINDAMGLIKADVAKNGNTDLSHLTRPTKAGILGLMSGAAYDGQSFVFGAGQVTIKKSGASDCVIKVPSLTVTTQSSSGPSSTTSTPSTPSTTPTTAQVTTTTGTNGATAVAVTTVPDSAPIVSGGTSSLSVTVPSDTMAAAVASATSAAGSHAEISVSAPASAIVSALSDSTVKQVALKLSVPSDVAYGTVAKADVVVNLDSSVLEAAKQTQKDVTVGVVDQLTGREAYSWTFKGSDLASSGNAVKAVDLALSVKTSTLDPSVTSALPASTKGVVLSFGNNGVLPAPATVKIYVGDQGYKPNQAAYLYYYNSATGKLETVGSSAAYTVDAEGYVTVKIDHCSQYVVVPNQVPAVQPVTIDTGKKISVKAGKTYQFKITSSSKPTFVSGNGSVFTVAASGSKGNSYFFKVTAVGKVGASTGFYLNGGKTPCTVGTIA